MRVFKKIVYLSSLSLAIFSLETFASGYKMEFQSASVLADGGDAAVVEDAGTNWYNSAGLVYIPQQLVFSLIDVFAPTYFAGSVTAPTTLLPPLTAFGSPYSATGSASSHPESLIPAFHYAMPLDEKIAVGLSVVPAWGFTEDYGSGSLVRYNLIRVYTKTIDIAPSFAIKLNNQWSVGLGPDIHYFSVLSKSAVNTAAPALAIGESISRFSADNWTYGAHVGILYRYDDVTRVGLNYRSKIVANLDGYSDFAGPGIGSFESGIFNLNFPLPPTTSLSVYRDISPMLALMGTLAFDQWSVLKQYRATNYVLPPTVPGAPPTTIPVTLQANMHNTLDVSVGTHVRLNEQLMLRGSLKYEPTPTTAAFRSVNFPDGDKLGLNIGSHYRVTKKLSVDLIYAHVFVKKVTINDVNPVTLAAARGHQKTNINLLGGQLVWDL